MSRAAFHAELARTLFRGTLPDWQREPVDALVEAGRARDRSLEDVAYALATAYHETGRFKFMHEIGRGEGRDYGAPVTLIRGKTAVYYGRGFPQLTWLRNYAIQSPIVGVDLVNEPDRAAEPAISAVILWEGMIRGSFTGQNLADHLRPGAVDYVGARRIINGVDRAEDIAAIARQFEAALRLLGAEPAAPVCPNPACPMRTA